MMRFLTLPMYIQVYRDRFVIRVFGEVERELEGRPSQPFTTQRLLVGNFSEAEKTLSRGIKQLLGHGLIRKSPVVVIHPMEKTEGGLSEVEIRVFRELAFGSGAAKVVVYEGQALGKKEVLEKIANG